jgi:hypothetical protein
MKIVHRIQSVIFALALVIVSMIFAFGQESPEAAQAKKERIEAERLWEQMVKVKGGREKLHSISNMMLTKGNNPDGIQMEFYVFPNKYWEWSKDQGLHNLMFVTMANLDQGLFLVAGHNGLATDLKNLSEKERADYRETYLIEACTFLLETRWLKPTPIRVTQEIVNKERLDVVETRFSTLEYYRGWGLDFYIDPETLVVRGVRDYSIPWGRGGYWAFDNYSAINGIQVPQTANRFLSMKDVKKLNCCIQTYQFNVEYDEKLFERQPSAEAGPDAWKPKAKP